MVGGVEARHDRRVGGQRQRRHGRGLREEDAAAREGVEGRRAGIPVAVAPDVVGAGGVEGDEDDVRLRHPPLGPPRVKGLPGRPVRVTSDHEEQGNGQAGGDDDEQRKDGPESGSGGLHGSSGRTWPRPYSRLGTEPITVSRRLCQPRLSCFGDR